MWDFTSPLKEPALSKSSLGVWVFDHGPSSLCFSKKDIEGPCLGALGDEPGLGQGLSPAAAAPRSLLWDSGCLPESWQQAELCVPGCNTLCQCTVQADRAYIHLCVLVTLPVWVCHSALLAQAPSVPSAQLPCATLPHAACLPPRCL